MLDQMRDFFECGYVKPKYDKAGTFVYLVKSIDDLVAKIVPFFREHPLIVKRNQFEKFAEAVGIQRSKAHLTVAGKERIAQLKSGTSETIRQAPAQAG